MHHLGKTRSAHQANHLLQTPDTFVRAPLPGMHKATAIVHAAPAMGARFTQYTAEFEAGGSMAPAFAQRFLYVLEGEVKIDGAILAAGDYAYFPPEHASNVSAKSVARAAVIEKLYRPLPGISAPAFFTGRETNVAAAFLNGDNALEVRALMPDNPSFDFAVNTMTYLPGATLPQVEIHVMEHGLLMLAGGGIYRLGERWYPAVAGDFMWMAPFCPQWFGALGKTPAKYLIYKDWNR
ncbi:MAG TPA: (S)-ureidoglycine aminohydrolase [Bryobacteraceae bacterium]|jgi:(S)-ureidoglycine aminohydrolase|nr:(S)-ureidoglycine aminohydrolase [Bryobacteraceae bacterium]